MLASDFYVYVMFRPNGSPCYVGKGRGARWSKHERASHSAHLSAIISQAGGSIPKVKVRENLTEGEAFAAEVAFIAAIGREVHGGPLVNQTDGGDGASGNVLSSETRGKIRVANLGRKFSPESVAKSAAARRGAKRSAESRERIGAAGRGREASPETRAKLSAAHLGKKRTAESRANMSAAQIKRFALKQGESKCCSR